MGEMHAIQVFEVSLLTNSCQNQIYGCRYVNTTAVKSKISFIDGDKGVLRYRGYPIEQLAERSNFLEVQSCKCLNTNSCAWQILITPAVLFDCTALESGIS